MKKSPITLHPCLQSILQGESPSFDDLFTAIHPNLPLLNELQNTPQDPEWHAEGNVHIHSRMTLNALYQVLDQYELAEINAEERMLVILASSLHDIAKAITTRHADIEGINRIIAPKHAQKGRSYLASLLGSLGLNAEQVEHIFSLVGFHHQPRTILRRTPDAHGAYWSLTRQVSPHLLNLLCQADLRGRICPDQDSLVEDQEYFFLCQQQALEELGPLHPEWDEIIHEQIKDLPPITQRFIRAHGRFEAEKGIITHPHEVIARSYKYRDRYAQLYIACGPSGIGKTTWMHQKYPQATLVSMDDIRKELTGSVTDQSKNRKVFQMAFNRVKSLLSTDQQIIWDATTLRKEYRDQLIALADRYQAFSKIEVFIAPIEMALKRNRERERQVPAHVIENQYQQWEIPQRDEAHEVNYLMVHGEQNWKDVDGEIACRE